MTTKNFFGRNFFWPPKWPKMVKIWPFLAKISIFEGFWPNLPNAAMNLPNFWYESCSYGFLWGNHTLYAWKVLTWQVFGHLRQKFGHFWPKLTVLRVFDLQLPNATMNLPNFWYGSYSHGLLWENHTLYAWKILIWLSFGHSRQKFGHFFPKLTVLRLFDP